MNHREPSWVPSAEEVRGGPVCVWCGVLANAHPDVCSNYPRVRAVPPDDFAALRTVDDALAYLTRWMCSASRPRCTCSTCQRGEEAAQLIRDVEAERARFVKYCRDVEALGPVNAAFEEGMELSDAVHAALADVHYAEGTPLFDAEVAKSQAEAERDEALNRLAELRATARLCVVAFDDITVPRSECCARNEALRQALADEAAPLHGVVPFDVPQPTEES